jgi:hypothetical protein
MLAVSSGKPGHDRLQLSGAGLHTTPQLVRVGDGEVVLERLDEVLVRHQQIFTGRAMKHDRFLLACLQGEFAC